MVAPLATATVYEEEHSMLNKSVVALVAALLASGALVGPCSAGSVFSFQYSFPAPDPSFDSVEASGTLFAETVPGGYLIVGIEGTRVLNGITEFINGLIAPGGFLGNSNMLYYPDASLLDGAGLSFTTSGAGDDGFGDVNLYSSVDNTGIIYTEAGATIGFGTLTVSEVPEPSTLVLLTVGVAGIGTWTRRRRKKPACEH
jgi:PEP-CTERM motif